MRGKGVEKNCTNMKIEEDKGRETPKLRETQKQTELQGKHAASRVLNGCWINRRCNTNHKEGGEEGGGRRRRKRRDYPLSAKK